MGNTNGDAAFGVDPTPQAKLIESEPGLQIYQNQQGEEFEQYLVPYSSHSQDVYQFRINNRHPQLVDVLYAGKKHTIQDKNKH